ncbi:GIY-YIG nuclease family protein [Candidatus Pollutiaquabacter sp.]|uniref:GIY-YIG nuclease family protein n=1 Tax=Candidatus Pollutiaquabacter sp. TaxID=3416354 RepID=UPI003C9E5CB3|nr:GIY-YIG nuclease family protein [Bacteroidota bacterium]
MWYFVYILKLNDGRHYVGRTSDLRARVKRHQSGGSVFTSKHRPVSLIWCAAFQQKERAVHFEHYLKTGSGRAFARKRFIPNSE